MAAPRLISGEEHYDQVVARVLAARFSVWISTANLKDLRVRQGRHYRTFLASFDELASRGVDLRILHAKLPSRAFRDSFDSFDRLVGGGLELRLCPRVHMKTVIVDGELLYIGSANWTGAGMGVRRAQRRNFELGVSTTDPVMLDQVQALYEDIWWGRACSACTLKDRCEAPLSS